MGDRVPTELKTAPQVFHRLKPGVRVRVDLPHFPPCRYCNGVAQAALDVAHAGASYAAFTDFDHKPKCPALVCERCGLRHRLCGCTPTEDVDDAC